MNQQTNSNESPQSNDSKKPSLWVYALVVTVILVGVIWLLFMPNLQEPEMKPKPAPIAVEPAAVIEDEPALETFSSSTLDNQIEQLEPEMPIALKTTDEAAKNEPMAEPIIEVESEVTVEPVVEKDDAWLMAEMIELLPTKALVSLVQQDELINNFVVFVDNASRGELLTSFSPINEPEGKFGAIEDNDNQLSFTLNPESYQRYNVHAELFSALPVEKSLEVYKELRNPIENAHQQLGYLEGSFDRKLTRLLDYLIDTPVVSGDIKLVAPSAMYQFAEPELEELMAIQKLLIRMGPSNQKKIQAKLAEFRMALN